MIFKFQSVYSFSGYFWTALICIFFSKGILTLNRVNLELCDILSGLEYNLCKMSLFIIILYKKVKLSLLPIQINALWRLIKINLSRHFILTKNNFQEHNRSWFIVRKIMRVLHLIYFKVLNLVNSLMNYSSVRKSLKSYIRFSIICYKT